MSTPAVIGNKIISVVSMLVADEEITLFTKEGNMLKLSEETYYNIDAIVEKLTPLLTGSNIVEFTLSDFFILTKGSISKDEEYEDVGHITIQSFNGVGVEGVFFPKKPVVIVKTEEGDVEIEEIGNLEKHMKRAVEDDSPSVANFLRRMASMGSKRKHSSDDLMQFIKLSELPLTNDGCILAYKRVKANTDKDTRKEYPYADCHSGSIYQAVGTRVTMAVNLVDDNNRNSCSTGLHVANLGYMKQFGGSNIMIVKIAPENFIAVPHREATKARVCSYDIIGVMNARSYKLASDSIQVTDNDHLDDLISEAVAGNSIEPHTEIHVGTREVLKTVSLVGKTMTKKTPAKRPSGKPLTETKKKKFTAVKKALGLKKKTIAEYCEGLYKAFLRGDLAAFVELVKTKKAKKKSWAALGFSQGQVQRIEKGIRENKHALLP